MVRRHTIIGESEGNIQRRINLLMLPFEDERRRGVQKIGIFQLGSKG